MPRQADPQRLKCNGKMIVTAIKIGAPEDQLMSYSLPNRSNYYSLFFKSRYALLA